jgi:hypothetical protein
MEMNACYSFGIYRLTSDIALIVAGNYVAEYLSAKVAFCFEEFCNPKVPYY